MKRYSHQIHTRIWTSRLVAVGLGFSGLSGVAATPDGQASGAPGATTSNSQGNSQNWEDQFTSRMEHIQKEMDDLFRDSVSDLDSIDKGALGGPKFDASATVQDRGDNYVATFNLPKRDLSDVKVNVKEGILSVNASAEQTTRSDSADKSNSSETEMLNQYEQLVTLPGPVDAARMKVDKHGDSIVVTIPKKDEKTASGK
jgi:HSP20 family molecular chaperone IbpA